MKKINERSCFEKLDLFGVNFELRMQNYEKYRTKTGATASIIYFIICSIWAFALLYGFVNNPRYSTLTFEEPTNSKQILWNNENFNLAVRLPNFYDSNNNIINRPDMFYIRAIQRSRNNSRIFEKSGKETKIPIDSKKCNISNIFSNNSNQENLEDYNDMNIICFNFNETHFIKNSEFTNHSYIKIEIWVNKTYFKEYISLVKNHMKTDPYYINIIFPVNIISNDYTKSNQFINGIFLFLNEKEKTIADIYLKQNIYTLDNNVLFSNPIDYHYNEYYSHQAHNIIDDFFYNFNLTISEEQNYINNSEDPKIAKIYIRNHVMGSRYIKNRQKILPFLQNVNSIYINIFITIKVLFLFTNLKKAKMDILGELFKIDFNIEENDFKKGITENKYFKNIKDELVDEIKNIKSSKFNKEDINNEKLDKNSNKNNLQDINVDKNFHHNNIRNEILDLNENNIEPRKYENNYNINQSSERKNIIKGFHDDKMKSNNKSTISLVEINICHDKSDEGIEAQKSYFFKNEEKSIEIDRRKDLSYDELKGKKIIVGDYHNKKVGTNKSLLKRFSLKIILKNLFKCHFSRIRDSFKYFHNAEKLFNDYFDIRHFIKRINEIEELKEILLNDNQKTIFEFLSYPSHKIKQQTSKNYSYNPIFYIENEKKVILKAYQSLYNENDYQLKSKRLVNMFENLINH